MAELKIKDWKPAKKGGYEVAQVKKGRRLYGEIRRYQNGVTLYWAFRYPDEIFLETDSWAIDCETITALKSKFVQFIGIMVTTGDLYLTFASSWEDKALGAQVLDYSKHVGVAPGAKGKFGARQWYLPRYAFARYIAPLQNTLQIMRIKGRR